MSEIKQQQALKRWQVTAESTLSQLDLLKQVPRGEQLTPELFQCLVLDAINRAGAEINQLQAWKEVAQYACHRLKVIHSADAVPSIDVVADAISKQALSEEFLR